MTHIALSFENNINIQPSTSRISQFDMLKYEGRISSFSGGVEIHVTREGLPLTGKKLFRNVLAQKFFDRLRNQAYLSDYGRIENNKNVFYFEFLNGEIKYYTRREIIKLAKEEEE